MKMVTETVYYLTMNAADRKVLHQILELIPAGIAEKTDILSKLFAQVDMELRPKVKDWLQGLVQNPVCSYEPAHIGEFRKRLFETLAHPMGQVFPPATATDDDDIPF